MSLLITAGTPFVTIPAAQSPAGVRSRIRRGGQVSDPAPGSGLGSAVGVRSRIGRGGQVSDPLRGSGPRFAARVRSRRLIGDLTPASDRRPDPGVGSKT